MGSNPAIPTNYSHMPLTRENHFVPEWYQRGFYNEAVQGEFFVLDKNPDFWIELSNGQRKFVKGKQAFPHGPRKFLRLKDLYTTTILGEPNDEIERLLFGRIDRVGARAVAGLKLFPIDPRMNEAALSEEIGDPNEHIVGLVEYMDAQKWRTPKGLDKLKALSGQSSSLSQNWLMQTLQKIRQFYCTTWAEGLWELVNANQSGIKFIFSDDPVTIYNCDHFPGAESCVYPNDPHPYELGSRTLFPLDMNNCLIITNVEYAKNPNRKNARKPRRNARAYDQTLISYLDVHKNRSLTDQEVAAINFIIKTRAVRYIAAAKVEWLYPERTLTSSHWPNLDKFLQHTGFSWLLASGETIIRYRDDSIMTTNPFGERTHVPGWFVRRNPRD